MSIDLINPPPGYEVIDYLGGGAMGDVYLARQVSLGRNVALKVSKRDITKELNTTLERLMAEALTIARLDHPNIVPVYDCISHDGRVFIVMKHVEGFTLGDLLKGDCEEFAAPPYCHFFKAGRVRREAIIEIAIRVAEALAYAHERGIYHRDIKPSNIFIDRKGRIVLIDFGIARDSTKQGMTATGVVIGTPYYMSPEQIRGVALDGRSDLYSLGCVLFHCLTGRVPFNDTNEVMVCIKHLNDPLPSIDSIVSDVDPVLNRIIIRLLEKDPDCRMESAEELAACLAAIQPPSTDSLRAATVLRALDSRGSSTVIPRIDQYAPESQPEQATSPRRTSRTAIAAVAVLGFLAILAAMQRWPAQDPAPVSAAGPNEVAVATELESGVPTGGAAAGVSSEVSAIPLEVAAVPRRLEPVPEDDAMRAPSPSPTPEPTSEPPPVPLWVAVAPPEGLVVTREGWQPFVDWLAPRGQRYEILQPYLTSETELIGEYVYINLQNPFDQNLEIALIATLAITETRVTRTPFALNPEDPRIFTLHRGSPFRDAEDDHTLYDGRRLVIPANGNLSVPLIPIGGGDRAILSVEADIVSMVVAGRGPRLDFGSHEEVFPPTEAPGLDQAVSNVVSAAPVRFRQDASAFGATDALRAVLQAQTRVVLPQVTGRQTGAEALSDAEATKSILGFLLEVEKRAHEGSTLLPSLITSPTLEATLNGGAELELALDIEPGVYRVSAVILAGFQHVNVTHRDGSEREAVRTLAGMGVVQYPVRLADRGGRVRLPLLRWAMQRDQEAVISSRIEIKTLAVLLHDPQASDSESQPPRFRRITNLEASR